MTSPEYECSPCSEMRGIPNTSAMRGINLEVPKGTWGRKNGETLKPFSEGVKALHDGGEHHVFSSLESALGGMCLVWLQLPQRSSQQGTLEGWKGRDAADKKGRS